MQKSGFPKMRHYIGFWQIGSHIAAIVNCCVPTAVKRILFPTRIASFLLVASFSKIFTKLVMSLLLGASFNTKL